MAAGAARDGTGGESRRGISHVRFPEKNIGDACQVQPGGVEKQVIFRNYTADHQCTGVWGGALVARIRGLDLELLSEPDAGFVRGMGSLNQLLGD